MHSVSLIVSLLLGFSFVSSVQPERVVDQMYISFDRIRYCVRRLNGTHEIGCQSAMNGNSGRMYMIDNNQEFNSYLLDGKTIDASPAFIVALNADLFDTTHVDRLITGLGKKLNGLLVYLKSNDSRPADFSHDEQCPNRRESFYLNQTTVNWNPRGTGLFFRSFPFPIMLIDEEDDYQRLAKFSKQSASQTYGLELKVFQNAAHTSRTCIRRNDISHSLIDLQETFCDPIGGLNVYSKLPQSIKVVAEPRAEKSVVLVLARTDAFQMFLKTKGPTGGAQQPAVALITFLALAHLVGQAQVEFNQQGKEIIFVTLDGDALDYSASFKFMFDMLNGYFPTGDSSEQRIKVEHIHSVLELQSMNPMGKLRLHSYPPALINQTFIDILTRDKSRIDPVASGSPLPPASAQIFLRHNASRSFPAYILTSASETQLSNHYYHSFFDDPSTLAINVSTLEYNTSTALSQWVKGVVDSVGQSLIEFYVGTPKSVTIAQEIVNNLVYCVLKSINCPLIHNVTNQSVGSSFDSFDLAPMPFAINTYPTSSTPTFAFVQNLLGYFLRDRTLDRQNTTEAACKDLAKNDSLRAYTYVGGYVPSIQFDPSYSGYCVRSYVRTIQSTSPAFVIDSYDLSQTTYPAWTESRWASISLRLFLIPSRTHEIITLIVGVLLLSISFLVLLVLRLYTKISLLQPSSS